MRTSPRPDETARRPLSKAVYADAEFRAAVGKIGYDDSMARDHAISNLANRAPAFWFKGSVLHAQIAELSAEANRFASLERALDSMEDHYVRTGQSGKRIRKSEVFDSLIPLNSAAMNELYSAYLAIGTFRERDEIAGRSIPTDLAEDMGVEIGEGEEA